MVDLEKSKKKLELERDEVEKKIDYYADLRDNKLSRMAELNLEKIKLEEEQFSPIHVLNKQGEYDRQQSDLVGEIDWIVKHLEAVEKIIYEIKEVAEDAKNYEHIYWQYMEKIWSLNSRIKQIKITKCTDCGREIYEK